MSFLGLNEIANYAGDLLGRVTGSKKANKQQQENFENQLQIRVADGLKAGINPLAAIGASGNYQPFFSTNDPSSAIAATMDVAKGASDGLKKLFVKKAKDDMDYDSESKALDLEGQRLDNRIKAARLSEIMHNVAPSSKEVPVEKPNRIGAKPLFDIVYDLRDRPRLVVNQDVMEGDADNPGYLSSIKHAVSTGLINLITGKINSEQERMRIDDMYYNMTGRHIDNLDELYFAPSEGALSTAMLIRGVS